MIALWRGCNFAVEKIPIMRKTFFTVLTILALTTTIMHAGEITTRWANLFEACPPTMGSDMALGENAVYYVAVAGTTKGAGDSGFPKEYSDPTLSIYYHPLFF